MTWPDEGTRAVLVTDGKRFAAERTSAGVLLRIPANHAKTWDLKAILPS